MALKTVTALVCGEEEKEHLITLKPQIIRKGLQGLTYIESRNNERMLTGQK